MEPSDLASDSRCWCLTGTQAQGAIIYLLNQIAGGTMTKEQVEANSACWCFTGSTFERAAIYLLAQILANGGGGGGGGGGITNGNYGGVAPAVAVTTPFAFDTSTGFLWYNSGTAGSPVWNNV